MPVKVFTSKTLSFLLYFSFSFTFLCEQLDSVLCRVTVVSHYMLLLAFLKTYWEVFIWTVLDRVGQKGRHEGSK